MTHTPGNDPHMLAKLDLQQWLDMIYPSNPSSISVLRPEPTLRPMQRMMQQLKLRMRLATLISVVGTNGKGTCVALLQQLALQTGLRVATFTSPHLLHFNERVCLNGRPVADADLICAFTSIETARCRMVDPPLLTFFEYTMLAAWIIFTQQHQQHGLDIIILEAGIGARFDAINCWDADYALISSIGLDHCERLGHSLQAIAAEKAAIMRKGQPIVFADSKNTAQQLNLERLALQHAAHLHCLDADYHLSRQNQHTRITCSTGLQYTVPLQHNLMPIKTIAACLELCALAGIGQRLTELQLQSALQQAALPARCQITHYANCTLIIDVAHNAHACQRLCDQCRQLSPPAITGNPNHAPKANQGSTQIFVGLLRDKDYQCMVDALAMISGEIVLVALEMPRACTLQQLEDIKKTNPMLECVIMSEAEFSSQFKTIMQLNIKKKNQELTLQQDPAAMHAPSATRHPSHIHIVCGSFYLAARALELQSAEELTNKTLA